MGSFVGCCGLVVKRLFMFGLDSRLFGSFFVWFIALVFTVGVMLREVFA